MRRRFINNHKTFDYSKYMTIEALEDGYEVYFSRDVEYNLNGYKWVPLKANLGSPILKKGDLLSLRCSLMPNETFGHFFDNGKAINLRGNILSLIFKDDINLDISDYSNVFNGTFTRNNIVSVENNFLPATTLALNCYYNMFCDCTSLTTAPELPATTLADYCYYNMFCDCTSLTTAPELPATTLADYCYYNMFCDCTKLNYIKMLATDISASNCLSNWVYNVSSTGTFVKHPEATWDVRDDSGIPTGWTVVNDGEESGGGKIENKASLSEGTNSWVLMFDYPVNSNLIIHFTDGPLYMLAGAKDIDTGYPTFDKPTIESIEPSSDDMYNYTF